MGNLVGLIVVVGILACFVYGAIRIHRDVLSFSDEIWARAGFDRRDELLWSFHWALWPLCGIGFLFTAIYYWGIRPKLLRAQAGQSPDK